MARPLKLTHSLLLKITPAQRDAIDNWRRTQSPIPSRAEAIRQLVALALELSAAK